MKFFPRELFRDVRHLVNRSVKVGKIILFQIHFHPFDGEKKGNGRDVGTMKHFHVSPNKINETTIFSPER